MKRNGIKSRKIRKLIITCTLTAVILIVSTYTWFIGMQQVKVSNFEVEIATTEGLFISMDGEEWGYELNAKSATAYTGNTNTWAPNGLKPLSSVGDLDSNVSRMKLFEKGSMTTTPGGYRLLASRVDNYSENASKTGLVQGDGYVAFDLFIMNMSGNEYYADNQPLNEEAIYLTTNSSVSVKLNGSGSENGIEGTGIENSVRVAFAQIGRIKADGWEEKVSTITSIDCDGDSSNGVTGICRNAQIWEPNETEHVDGAINWYKKSCVERIDENLTLSESYKFTNDGKTPTPCGNISGAIPTYAISRVIGINDYVDIYDGKEYNKYEENTALYSAYKARNSNGSEDANYKLVSFPYFTDTMKNKVGTDRPTFMTLAPNSITKVRVYIWIEGQDIDNYDFAQIGKTISINFGFTKERFTAEDINYDGPMEYTPEGVKIPQSGEGA